MVDGVGGGKILPTLYTGALEANMKQWLIETGGLINSFASPTEGQPAFCSSGASGFQRHKQYYYHGSYGKWIYARHDISRVEYYINRLSDLSLESAAGTHSEIEADPGWIQTTGSTSGSQSRVSFRVPVVMNRGKAFEFTCLSQPVSVAAAEIEVGFIDNTVLPADLRGAGHTFAAFQYDPAVSANWLAVQNDGGGSPTVVDTGTACVAGTFYLLQMISNEADIKYFINGNIEATISATIPATGTSLEPTWFVNNTAAADKELETKYCKIMSDFV